MILFWHVLKSPLKVRGCHSFCSVFTVHKGHQIMNFFNPFDVGQEIMSKMWFSGWIIVPLTRQSSLMA